MSLLFKIQFIAETIDGFNDAFLNLIRESLTYILTLFTPSLFKSQVYIRNKLQRISLSFIQFLLICNVLVHSFFRSS